MLDPSPRVGIGYRREIHDWIVARLARFDVLEITVDHYLISGANRRREMAALADRIPLVGHGIGLSVGTAVPPDRDYLDRVARAIDDLRIPAYSEHLAFTKVPGRDLANLLPLPRTEAVAAQVIENVRIVRSHIPVPFSLENITYLFDYPDSVIDEVEFLKLICRETGSGILLDVENLHLNSRGFAYDPRAFIDALPPGSIHGIHTAGGRVIEGTPVDTHDHPVPAETTALLAHVLQRHRPDTIVLERDDRLQETEELIADIDRIREVVAAAASHEDNGESGFTKASA